MSRIAGVTREGADPFTKVVYRMVERDYGKVPEPLKLFAHHKKLMLGYGGLEKSLEMSKRVSEKYKALGEIKAAAMAGCEYCLDIGSWVAQNSGVTEKQLQQLHRFRESDAFDETEKLVLAYAEGMTKTPVEVPEELFDQLRRRFGDAELVELTAAIATENYRARFNWALGATPDGYSEGAYCLRPEAEALAGDGAAAG
jgi:AhpD family alkylhydroperoxidase